MSGSKHAVHIIHTSSAGHDERGIVHTSHIGKAEAYGQRKYKGHFRASTAREDLLLLSAYCLQTNETLGSGKKLA